MSEGLSGSITINGIMVKELHNSYLCEFMYDGLVWSSSEQLYQAMKFKYVYERDLIHEEGKIPYIAWQIGQMKRPLIDDFEERKSQNMYLAVLAKIMANPKIYSILQLKGDIVCNCENEYWKDHNEKILTKIRNDITF